MRIFQAGNFFWRTIPVYKTIGNIFLLPTDLATEFDIIDERYADGIFCR
jgi:hypothetical protein